MPKRLVVCADGTWNEPTPKDDGTPTNVFKIACAITPCAADGVRQVVYYHPGVGTGWDMLDKVLGGATGVGISKNILDAYVFLMCNYEPGDFLWFFGFSRGAYTVRSLGGLIRNSGIPRPDRFDKLWDAYDLYRRRDDRSHPRSDEAANFREEYTYRESRPPADPRGRDTSITFVGVWDTVGALGVPGGLSRYLRKRALSFHDCQLSRYIDHAYQALAIDEHRPAFSPTLWTKRDPGDLPGQTMEQVWFAGVHSNIGGGYPDTGLSDEAFEWLTSKATAYGLEIERSRLPLKPRYDGRLMSSQKVLYRVMGVWSKIVNPIRRWYANRWKSVLAATDMAIASGTTWHGDYVRPIPSHTPLHASVTDRMTDVSCWYAPTNKGLLQRPVLSLVRPGSPDTPKPEPATRSGPVNAGSDAPDEARPT